MPGSIAPQDAHVDRILSELSIKFTNEAFVAELLFPSLTVKKESDKFFVYDKSNFRREKTRRAAGDESNEITFGLSTNDYSCEEESLHGVIPDRTRKNADDPLNLDMDTTETVTEKLFITQEVAAYNAAISIASGTTLVGGDQWSDYTNSDPLAKIEAGRAIIYGKVFRNPNTMIVSKPVHDMLRHHPKVVDRFKYTNPYGLVTIDQLKSLFEVENYIVAGAGENTAPEGQADSLAYIWAKTTVLAYVNKVTNIKSFTFGKTLRVKGYRETLTWREAKRKSDIVEVSDLYTVKIVSADAGYWFKTCIA